MLGFPDPPAQVFAVGKDECAAVWWTAPADETITGWEVHRFRRDKMKLDSEVWHDKGFIPFPLMLKNQVTICDLCNDYEYHFKVKSVNAKGVGVESIGSNVVMVEKPLPAGWFRFLDRATKKHYYANIKLNMSSWVRPELDLWFLDEAIQLNFETRELDHLKLLYKEEIAHFGCVSIDQFMDVLQEIGERCSKQWITRLFRGYSGAATLKTWKHFMEVVDHIKKNRMGGVGVLIVKNPMEKLMTCLQRKRIGTILRTKKEKMGDW